MTKRALRFGVAVMLFTSLVSGAFGVSCRRRVLPEEEALQKAVGENARPIEGRVVGFPYAPRKRATRGASGDDLRLAAIASQVIATHRSTRAKAIAHLLRGESEQSSRELRSLILREPRNADLWSDQAVVSLHEGVARGNARELVSAVAAADEALRIEPSHPEAAFNRAVALEELSLAEPAARAYEAYLQIDGTSEWAHEARMRLRALRRNARQPWRVTVSKLEQAAASGDHRTTFEIVTHYAREARTSGETIYLADWARAVLAGQDARAERPLRIAEGIGTALAAATGESLLRDATATARAAVGSRRRVLASAYVAYDDARRAYARRSITQAKTLFDEAIRGFDEVRSPMTLVARHFAANAAFDRNEAVESLTVQNHLERITPQQYRALHAQILWQRSTIYGSNGRYHEALADSERSGALFAALGEHENEARMRAQAAALFGRLGDLTSAWRLWREVFATIPAGETPVLLVLSLNATARAEMREGRWDHAEALFGLQLELPQNSRTRFDAILGAAYSAIRNSRAVELPIGELDAAAAAIENLEQRQSALHDARLARAALSKTDTAPQAITLLTGVIDSDERHGYTSRLPTAYRERARLHRATGAVEAAIADLRRAVRVIEEQGASVTRDDLRSSFFGAAGDAFADLADLLARNGNPRETFALLDRRHGFTGEFVTQPRRDIQPLPDGTVIVQYATFENHLLLAIRDRTGFRTATVDVRRQDLEKLVRHFREAIIANDPAIRIYGAKLHALLIQPVETETFENLVIVPDDLIATVPFAVLSSGRGTFLVERTRISIATSANVRTAAATSSARPAVVVGDPAFDGRMFPRLPRLRGAADEARRVARKYRSAILMTGSDATPKQVLESLRRAGIVHLAAHALVNAQDARDSSILLAANGDERGPVYLREIRHLSLEGQPVVVLAGCGTALRGGGKSTLRSLADAFMVAGSRAVIATLWDLDDEASSAFSEALHERLARGDEPGAALRDTQRLMIASSREVRMWSSFQLYEPGVLAP